MQLQRAVRGGLIHPDDATGEATPIEAAEASEGCVTSIDRIDGPVATVAFLFSRSSSSTSSTS